MRKVWIFQQKNRSGLFVGWYESGHRRAKALPTQSLAEHYRQLKYTQLNSDVFVGLIDISWRDLINEYIDHKKATGLTKSSITQIIFTLNCFNSFSAITSSKQINQSAIDNFLLHRRDQVRRPTLNKDIRNLVSLFRWARMNRYINPVTLKQFKVPEKIVRCLSPGKVRLLLYAALLQSPPVYYRLILAISTGLRRGDIESLTISDFDLQAGYCKTRSQKTGKALNRPLPKSLLPFLAEFLKSVPGPKIFNEPFPRKKWDRIRNACNLSGLKFKDLRSTFASALAQRNVGTAITQKLLEHSTPQLTNQIYLNVSPALRDAIEKLPLDEWLR